MSLDDRMSRLIGQIYRADSESAWNAVGDEVLRSTGGCAGLQTTVDLVSGQMADFRYFGRETSGIAQAMADYPDIKDDDPTLVWAIANPQAGFCASDAVIAREGYATDPFVAWNHARLGATHWYVCYSRPGEGMSHSLSLHIPAAVGAATAEQIAKLRLVFDHQTCAAWLRRHPAESDTGTWIVLDDDGRVRSLSAAAERLVALGDGLRIVGGRIVTTLAGAQAGLERCLARVAGAAETGAGPAALWIDRPSARKALLVRVRPLMVRFAGLCGVRAGLHLEIVEPSGDHDAPPLGGLFDLTAREAEVLAALIAGHSLESLAGALGMSSNTARVHLHAIFTKTRTTRQTELLRLCAQVGAMQG